MRYGILRLLRRYGYDVQRYGPHHDPMRRLKQAMERQHVSTILDIGANVGQFGQRLRINGYQGRIISIEPLSRARAKLVAATRDDPLWSVAKRYALGDKCGDIEINVAANLQSSSVLKMLDRHLAGDPTSGYVGTETVRLVTLDAFLDEHPALADVSLALKIDTQGYEAQVLAGLDRWSENIKVIQAEMSLAPLYDGSAGFDEIYRIMEQRGYRCISIEPNFTDPQTYEVLQTDAIFERRGA
jgi:FkbM family methyltransferase